MKDLNHNCSFCGKCKDEVETMVAGAEANICSDCVNFASALVEAYRAGKADGSKKEKEDEQ